MIGGLKVAVRYTGDEIGDANVHRAALHAEGALAVQAAARLLDGHLGGVPQGNLFEILSTLRRVLLGHGTAGGSHISHYALPPS